MPAPLRPEAAPARRPRRAPRAAMRAGADGGAAAARLSVATYNLRGVSDRWAERRPLLAAELAALNADVLCLQETLGGGYGQDAAVLGARAGGFALLPCPAALTCLRGGGPPARAAAAAVEALLAAPPLARLAAALPARAEAARELCAARASAALARALGGASMALALPWFGNALALRAALVARAPTRHATRALGAWRAAQRAEILVPAGGAGGGAPFRVLLVNAHLDHAAAPATRAAQAAALLAWARAGAAAARADAALFGGDLNSPPGEALHAAFRAAGFASAFPPGAEPVTFPTGLRAPLADEGPPMCLDHLYVWAAPGVEARFEGVRLIGNEPAAWDKGLYASDHAGVAATLLLRRV
jgi:endonuclease/exonuclease/phosphatase family metal-dependent hydrolase